jgi:hypothetical protein
MSHPERGALAFSRRLLGILTVLNWIYGAGILLMLVWSFFQADTLYRALGVAEMATSERIRFGMQAIMLIGVLCVPVTNVALTRLLAIVQTVRAGDPFVIDNAARLRAIAWSTFALTAAGAVIGTIAETVTSSVQGLDVNWKFSFTPWLAVLLLFVLAQVFEQGARMRADLEGTV